MAEELSPETKEAWREIFQRKDKEGTGTLDAEELEECLQMCGLVPTDEDIAFLTKHFDSNGDGKLQIDELLDNVHIIYQHSLRSEELMAAFKKFDLNDDGYIRLPELLKILTYKDFMPVDEARKLLRVLTDKYDTDKDGKFNYAEFVTMLQDGDIASKLGFNFKS